MINQFRRQYPKGSLISELIKIKHGQYIVKVIIEVDQQILATALAAATTIETAEDRARERALTCLALETNTETQEKKPPSLPQPLTPSLETKPLVEQKPPSLPQSLTSFPKTPTNVADFIPPLPTHHPSSVSMDDLELNNHTDIDIHIEPETNGKNEQAETQPSLESTSKENDADFVSEIISQIDLQMERLNWTKEQGREYITRVYGKKTRKKLSYEELKEFLAYLQTQSLTSLPETSTNVVDSLPSLPTDDSPLFLNHDVELDNHTDIDIYIEPQTNGENEQAETQPSLDPTPMGNDADFVSETISQIDLHMDRLNWTKEQGREYTTRVYGKKSRLLLSDEELKEFLEYLQTQ